MPALYLGASPCGIAPLLLRLASGPLFAPIRRRRSSFKPTTDVGPYRLPKQVQKALGAALSPYRNAEAAFALATFLGRFWTVPGRLGTAFPIDRRALADHQELGLTEAKVRGAILTLERIGFLSRPQRPKGSPYKATEDGLRRKPILYAFGMLFRSHFETANRRRLLAEQSRVATRLPPTDTNSPKDRILFLRPKDMIMGQVSHLSKIEAPIDPENPLEKALARFKKMIGKP